MEQRSIRGGAGVSAVGFFAYAANIVAGAGSWDVNTFCTDSSDGIASVAATCVDYEADNHSTNALSTFGGVSEIMTGPTQAFGADAFTVANRPATGPAQWINGLVVDDGAVVAATGRAISIGQRTVGGTSVSSYPIVWTYTDSSGPERAVVMAATPGDTFDVYSTLFSTTPFNVSFSTNNVSLVGNGASTTLTLIAGSGTVLIHSNFVPTVGSVDNLGSSSAAFATTYSNAYYSGVTAGVSCTVTTPAHLTVLNGIVTLCN